MPKCRERRDGDPNQTSSSFKHSAGSVMAWACMSGSGMNSLIFIDDIRHDGSSTTNLEVTHAVCECTEKCNQSNLEELQYAIPTASITTKDLPSQSPNPNPTVHACHLLKRRLKGETPESKTASLEKYCKRRMQQFDVADWYSYCRQGIWNHILSVLHFKTIYSSAVAHLAIGSCVVPPPKKMCQVLSCWTHLDNIREKMLKFLCFLKSIFWSHT